MNSAVDSTDVSTVQSENRLAKSFLQFEDRTQAIIE